MTKQSKTPKPKAGGGFHAIAYSLRKARQVGGFFKLYKTLRSKNACKTCALGMGGQKGGMVDESGHFPSVCKKSIQAAVADMQGAIQDDFFDKFSLGQLGGFDSRQLEMSGRLTHPLWASAGDTHYRRISWSEAYAKITPKLKATPPDQSFFYMSGRSSNEAAFLLQLFARLYGTNNVNNCSYYCHQASGVGLTSVTGSGTATVVLEDLSHCDLVFLIGANPASNHPRLMHQLMKIRRRGGHIIVINPLKELGLVRFKVPSDPVSLLFGTDIASLYLQPHIGGDIALLAGIAKSILEKNAHDQNFIDQHCENFPEFKQQLDHLDIATLVERSGVPREQIEQAAEHYAQSKNTIFAWAMGITHHLHGVENVRMIANLSMIRGQLGKPHAGLLPIRGHSNVQGIGSVGVTPKLKQAIFDKLQSEYKIKLPTTKGLDTLSCLEQAKQGHIRLVLCLGGNLYGATPDSRFAADAFNALDMAVYLSTTLNIGHIKGRAKETLILPVQTRDEESQLTTQESMFNYVRISEGGITRHTGPKGEVEIIAHLARDVLGDNGPIDFNALTQHKNIRQMIAKIIPGYQQVAEIDETKEEFHLEGRTLHTPTFNTPSGKARFHNFPITDNQPQEDSPNAFRLMTIRSEGQFNSVVYEVEDFYRHQERRDVILMNQADCDRLNFSIDQPVTVT
ncbi:MAG: FdhF/YdeP family oxidoreductase, partial [Planctomycetes bacterium]|nr:FdhF/YdeP family oxidoreductase [Planctomycetota bacterium]